jgi:hypothetical protein
MPPVTFIPESTRGGQIPWAAFVKMRISRFDKRGCWQIKWFAENGWTSRFCGRNLKFMKSNGRKFVA